MARASAIVPARPPATKRLSVLADAAAHCTACHLYENATQTVFGAGPREAEIVVVGEQPGDREDREGAPFVGPAGRLLDQALEAAGIEPRSVYRTNAVKHFKWRPTSGKRRLHERPDRNEVEICKPWLIGELGLLSPRVVVALGATAAVSLFGRNVPIGRSRQRLMPSAITSAPVVVTYHPSSILRRTTDREAAMQELVDDLVYVAEQARRSPSKARPTQDARPSAQ